MGGLATGGRLKQPHLVNPEEIRESWVSRRVKFSKKSIPFIEATVDIVTKAMWGVVNEEADRGSKARIEGFDVAGKTGTAQVVGKQAGLKGEEYKDNAWFVGFAPYRNPEIVVARFR